MSVGEAVRGVDSTSIIAQEPAVSDQVDADVRPVADPVAAEDTRPNFGIPPVIWAIVDRIFDRVLRTGRVVASRKTIVGGKF